jgi:long-subunit fatty acid transport protein
MGEWDFTFGGNFNNQLYLGFTMGLTTIRYVEESTWEELDELDTIPFFGGYKFSQNLESTGSGINFKLGMIYRPADFFRLGIAIHSPTWNSLVDQYSTRIRTDLEDGQIREYNGPVFIPFDYNINTPFRAMGSMAFIIAQQGALNIDYEFIDYGMGRIRPLDRNFASEFNPINTVVRNKYGIAHQVRAGFEWRYEQMRFRFGGHYATSPFASSIRPAQTIDQSGFGFSGGLGYRGEKYYFDAAYAWSRTGAFLRPYTLENELTEGINFQQTDSRVMFTFGYLF